MKAISVLRVTLAMMAVLGLLVAFRLGGPVDGVLYTKYHFRGAPLTIEQVNQLLTTFQVCCVVVSAAFLFASVTVTHQRAFVLPSLVVSASAMQVAVLSPFYVSESLMSIRPHHLLPFAIAVLIPRLFRPIAKYMGHRPR